MRTTLAFFLICIFCSCGNKSTADTSNELDNNVMLDSNELMEKAATTKDHIHHIGDSIDHLKKTAEERVGD